MRHRKGMIIFMGGVDMEKEREENAQCRLERWNWQGAVATRHRSEVKDDSIPVNHLASL